MRRFTTQPDEKTPPNVTCPRSRWHTVVAIAIFIGHLLVSIVVMYPFYYVAWHVEDHSMDTIYRTVCISFSAILGWMFAATLPLPRGRQTKLRITRRDQPRFFETINRAASIAGMNELTEVCMSSHVSAFSYRQGVWGVFGTPCSGFGLNLFHLLSVAELKALMIFHFAMVQSNNADAWFKERLTNNGWYIDHEPGYLRLRHHKQEIDPIRLIDEMAESELSSDKWNDLLVDWGLDPSLPLVVA